MIVTAGLTSFLTAVRVVHGYSRSSMTSRILRKGTYSDSVDFPGHPSGASLNLRVLGSIPRRLALLEHHSPLSTMNANDYSLPIRGNIECLYSALSDEAQQLLSPIRR
jgi:hypothetical protein